MRIVFMGTPAIAAKCLARLIDDGCDIVGVYTKPDTPKNRGMKLLPSEVKALAVQHDLPVYQPTTFRDEQTIETLRALQPDLILAVAYGKILPQAVLDIPPLGCVNIHASLLPKLRGAGPIQWSILNGDEKTGVTAMYMAAEMDTGDIIAMRETPITPEDTGTTLTERLAELGAALLSETVRSIEAGTVQRTPQDHTQATYAPMLSKALCPIDWAKPFAEISCQVRGLIPWPVATAELGGTRFKIFRVEPAENPGGKAPGTLLALDKRGLVVACEGGAVRVLELQAEGGRRMAAPDYFRGHPIELEG
jgi:methionyl-tRNA formyltransferase